MASTAVSGIGVLVGVGVGVAVGGFVAVGEGWSVGTAVAVDGGKAVGGLVGSAVVGTINGVTTGVGVACEHAARLNKKTTRI